MVYLIEFIIYLLNLMYGLINELIEFENNDW